MYRQIRGKGVQLSPLREALVVPSVLFVIIRDRKSEAIGNTAIKPSHRGPLSTLSQNAPLCDTPMPTRTKQMLLQFSNGSTSTGENRLTLRHLSPNFLVVVASR